MSLIKKIKQFINGSWQEFQLDANNIDNVATREWVTNAEKTIVGDTTFNGDILFDGGEIRLTNEVILSGSEVYYDGQYVGDFHPNAPNAYANKHWVESLVTNQVQYLGIVNSVDDIINAFYSSDSALGKAGDFVRAGSSFTIETETVHPGDIIIANNVVPYVSLVNYDIIHTEDPGNYVTLNTPQTISASKLFTGEIEEDPATNTGTLISQSMIVIAKAYEDSLWIDNGSIWYNGFGDTPSWRIDPVNGFRIGSATKYKSDYIEKDGYVYAFPEKSGTFALLEANGSQKIQTYAIENGSGAILEIDGRGLYSYDNDLDDYFYLNASEVKGGCNIKNDEGVIVNYGNYNLSFPAMMPDDTFIMKQQGSLGTIATREWAINKFANQMPWSQELIDSCVDLGGWTIRFNTNTDFETDSSKWPVTTWLISSGGYALGVGGPPRVQLKGIDGKQFDTITIAEYIGTTQWLLNKLTLPADFGHITKAVGTSGEPSAEYDALPIIYWNKWEHIMPGGFTKETVFDELKLIPALENTQNNRSAKLIIGGGNAPSSGMPDSSVEISYNGIYFKEGVSSESDWEISKSGTTIDQLTVNGTAAACCLYLAGPSTFGSFENLGGYIYSTSNESIYALPIFNDSQKSNICDLFAVSESNFNTIATQEWVQAQNFGSDIDTSNLVTLDGDQTIGGTKRFDNTVYIGNDGYNTPSGGLILGNWGMTVGSDVTSYTEYQNRQVFVRGTVNEGDRTFVFPLSNTIDAGGSKTETIATREWVNAQGFGGVDIGTELKAHDLKLFSNSNLESMYLHMTCESLEGGNYITRFNFNTALVFSGSYDEGGMLRVDVDGIRADGPLSVMSDLNLTNATVTINGTPGEAGQVLVSTGDGVEWKKNNIYMENDYLYIDI